MPNPGLLICDSDVLVQLFIANELRPLQILKSGYGIQPAITEEVDLELRWLGRHKDRFESQLDKTLKTRLITRLDKTFFQSLLGTASPGASWTSYQALGARYLGFVDKGEAYTHAAGVILRVPTASNDFRAIQVLQVQMVSLPVPVLRCFDLLVFGVQSGTLSIRDGEDARHQLLKSGEHVPKAFQHASFAAGATGFRCRLRDSATAGVAHSSPSGFSDTLLITRI